MATIWTWLVTSRLRRPLLWVAAAVAGFFALRSHHRRQGREQAEKQIQEDTYLGAIKRRQDRVQVEHNIRTDNATDELRKNWRRD